MMVQIQNQKMTNSSGNGQEISDILMSEYEPPKHIVELPYVCSEEMREERIKWANENLSKPIVGYMIGLLPGQTKTFFFRNNSDAVAFKMRWG